MAPARTRSRTHRRRRRCTASCDDVGVVGVFEAAAARTPDPARTVSAAAVMPRFRRGHGDPDGRRVVSIPTPAGGVTRRGLRRARSPNGRPPAPPLRLPRPDDAGEVNPHVAAIPYRRAHDAEGPYLNAGGVIEAAAGPYFGAAVEGQRPVRALIRRVLDQ